MAEFAASSEGEGRDRVVRLSGGSREARAAIAVGCGANLFRWSLRDERLGELNLIDAPAGLEELRSNPCYYGSPVLAPYPNRIRKGRFTFDGREYELEIDPQFGHAIHGAVYDRAWTLEELRGGTDEAVAVLSSTLEPELDGDYWPFALDLRLTYTLRAAEVMIRLEARNTDERPQPFGFGLHPYFRVPFVPESGWPDYDFQLPCGGLWELDETFVPTGRIEDIRGTKNDWREARRLSPELKLDHVFTQTEHDANGVTRAVIRHRPSGTEMVVVGDHRIREWVIFTPPGRDALAVEPYTCATDAFNLSSRFVDAGTIRLEPGAADSVEVRYALRTED